MEDNGSSSEEELELMALAVALVTRKRKRKHRIWVREVFQTRKEHGIGNLVDVMRVSNRYCYFK